MNTAKLKAAAEKATPGPWRRTATIFNGITCGPFSLSNEKVLANVAEKANAEFIAAANPAAVLELIAALEAAEKRAAELERENAAFLPVGVMSESAYHRLEASECRFIALWPRPGIYLPRKRPDDGVVVYARTELVGINLETGGE
ncbi:ead/Ea22-like family protein [Cronobacter sakazakii]|nr:ead/Ea22-like family protein [Cronobacter sakazakii]ELY4731224.1 ead/Ea22-like family protein [Cronobacter sakazakii]ELY4772743.1 ead/Ea22-like family protein [Cronobacter sakazakii]ELY4787477.1 ead/Ea22-like family protein [Cronobacter sakazakii]ELY4793194.1 ead/Ea22-like family protein [Cronobacter sakazakii]